MDKGSVRLVGARVVQSPLGVATAYERDVLPFVRPFTAALTASLPPGPLGMLLDHGAGTGEVAWAVEAQRPTGEMVLLDPSPTMAARLREVFRGRPRTTVVESSLSSWLGSLAELGEPLPVADLITSQLVLPFVPDKLLEL
jgi:trans-aconitate methyltransferase